MLVFPNASLDVVCNYRSVPSSGAPSRSGGSGVKSTWRQQHLEFQAALRAARGVTRMPAASRGARDTASYDSYVRVDTRIPCPHCGRRYADTTAERHIPKCKDILAKPRPPPAYASALAPIQVSLFSLLYCQHSTVILIINAWSCWCC